MKNDGGKSLGHAFYMNIPSMLMMLASAVLTTLFLRHALKEAQKQEESPSLVFGQPLPPFSWT